MSLKKYSRSANYSEEERTLLVSVVTAYLDSRRNKKTRPANTKAKEDAWEVLCVDFNAKSEKHRSKESLKTCFVGMKKAERRAKANLVAKGGNIQQPTGSARLFSAELPDLVKPRPPRALPLRKRQEADEAKKRQEADDTAKRQEAYDAAKRQEAYDAAKRQEADDAAKSQEAVNVPMAETADFTNHFLEGSDALAGVLVEPDDGWPPSHHPKRGPSPHGYSWQPLDYVSARLDDTRQDHLDEVRLEMMREDARRRRAQEEDDYATRKRVKQDEAELRIQILETELLIKKEILKQETKKTKDMDRMEV